MSTTSLIPHTSLSPLTVNRRPLSSPRRRITFRRPTAVVYASSHLSWLFPGDDHRLDADDFRGWLLLQPPPSPLTKTSGFPTFLVAGIGTSVALLLAAIAHFSFSKKGFRLSLRSPSSSLSSPVALEAEETRSVEFDAATSEQETEDETDVVESPDVVIEPVTLEKHQPQIIIASADSSQQEAVHVLKKLKIMDEDVKADALCTRRDYARWLVRASSLLERNPKYKVSTAVTLAGSFISAYEDMPFVDQDFDSIQALAEAGVVSSKLSSKHNLDGCFNFFPGRFISRKDLIEWRAQLEYDFAATRNQEILKQKVNLLDVREISADEEPGLFMDVLAGDNSLLRRVFGQIRRLQPNKPSTIAQAAVALTSGRMTEAIQNELLRLEAEESSRKVAKEEIKQELLDRGDIESYWSQKIQEEKARGAELEQLYMDAINNLEQEKIVQENAFSGLLRERAAMDCQKQLLNRLKEEVSELSEKLISERAQQVAEEENVRSLSYELQIKNEGVLDAKSVLEAEIEALRILRSWIEDEARKSEARSKVLEDVGRRWRSDRQF
ncbi:hypothetical protein RND81_02G203900 [Saponaria officinalis]|uniref:SLH domain-containing protein n=1 Tax=Saponaria officinalis TaxID=3572 RepID=A0AAW1MSJ4_SAPOF